MTTRFSSPARRFKLVAWLCMLIVTTLAGHAFAQDTAMQEGVVKDAPKPVWSESFEKGIGNAEPYYKDGKGAVISATPEGTILAALAGERTLEGFSMQVTNLPADRLITIKSRVRGDGELLIALNSSNGWVYMPVITLDNNWRDIEVDKANGPTGSVIRIYFIRSQAKPTGGKIEVDQIDAFASEPLQLEDAAVPSRKFEAEAFSDIPKTVVKDEQASGQKAVASKTYVRANSLPFPQTSKPVSVYVRVRSDAQKARLELSTTRTIKLQAVAAMDVPESAAWQWHEFRAVTAEEIGSKLAIAARVTKAGKGPVSMDCVVVSTEAGLKADALDAAADAQSEGPAAAIGPVQQAPVIDGKLDDAAWAQATTIGDFVHYNSFHPMSESTIAKLGYDDNYLYLMIKANESVLNVAAQRRDELLAKVTKRDDNTLRDDSFMMIIAANDSQDAYEFSFNSIGTLMDAHNSLTDLWGKRDLSWNADVKIATIQEDGYWTAELAIPLKDIGFSGTISGQNAKVILARVAQTRHETGTWNHSANGAHLPLNFGHLFFSTPPLALAPAGPFAAIEPGRNEFPVTLARLAANPANPANPANKTGVTIWSRIASDEQHSSTEQTYLPAATTQGSHVIDVSAAGPVKARWGAMNAATLEPLYVSPVISTSVQSSFAKLTFSTQGGYRVIINEQIVEQGQNASQKTITLPLRQGQNVIAIEAQTGQASVKLQGPSPLLSPAAWRAQTILASQANNASLTSLALDDRRWALAEQTAGSLDNEMQISAADGQGKPTMFRHTMMVGYTRIWPSPAPSYALPVNVTQPINFTAMGLKGKQLENWQMVLAVPKGYEVVGSTGHYGNHVPTQPRFDTKRDGSMTIDGQAYALYRVSTDKPILPNRHYTMSVFQVMVRCTDPDAITPGTKSNWYYWANANDQSVSEPRTSFIVETLPPLQGAQPKKFVMQLWGGIHVMDNEALREPLLDALQKAGFNEFCTSDRWTSDNGKKFGISTQLLLSYHSWSINVASHLKAFPEDRLVDVNGKTSSVNMCFTQLLGRGWATADEQIAKQIDDRRPAVAQYDYEYPPLTGGHACFCERCLSEFKKYNKLLDDVQLSPQIVASQYTTQWSDFMAFRVAQLMAKMKASVHKADPLVKFSVYSGYNSEQNASRYGLDWNYLAQTQGADIFACGYGRTRQIVQRTLEAAGSTPVIMGVLLTPYDPKIDAAVMPSSAARILRRAIDATGGVLLYERKSMDGRWWYDVSLVTRLIAAHEDLFLNARPTEIKAQDEASVQLLQNERESLLCLMNDTGKPKRISMQLPSNLGDGQSFYSSRSVKAGQAVAVTLEPGAVEVYVFAKGK